LLTASDTGVNALDNITRDTTPTFTGTVPRTTSCASSPTEALVGSDTTTSTGSYSVTSSALADGVRAMQVRFEDAAGNQSGASPTLNVTIDTVAPAAPTAAPDMTAATDTGISSTDNITRNNRPVFTGTRPLNTVVQLVQAPFFYGVDQTLTSTTYSITSEHADRRFVQLLRRVRRSSRKLVRAGSGAGGHDRHGRAGGDKFQLRLPDQPCRPRRVQRKRRSRPFPYRTSRSPM
jgi:hypothetical protein